MALSAYEIRVIVSAQDHFSSAFRRINSDLRYMSRMQQRAARDQADLNKQLNATQNLRRSALQEARSLRGGKASLQLEKDRLAAQKAYNSSVSKANGLTRGRKAAATALINQERLLSELPARRLDLEARRLILQSKLMKMMNSEVSQSSNEWRAAHKQFKATETRLANLPRLQAYLNARLDEGNQKVQRLGKSWGSAMRDVQQAKANLAAMDVLQERNLSRADSLRDAARRHGVAEKEIEKSLANQAAHMEKLAGLDRARARVQAAGHTGRIMTLGGGIGLAAGAGLANYAANFQRQVTLAATQTPGTATKNGLVVAQRNAEDLSKRILELSADYGIATEEITKSSYDIYSSIRFTGTAAEQYSKGFNAIKLSAMAAVGGLTNMDTAAKATIILANQFGDTTQELTRNLDTAFAIVRYGNMTFEQFTSMMTKVGSAASRAGYSLQDVAGIMAFLTKKSGKPDEAATWIDRMLQALQTPEFVKGMRLLHAPIDKDGKLKPLSQVMEQILKLGAANKGRGGIGMQNIIPFITSVGKHGFEGGAGLRSTIQAQRGLTFSLMDVKGLKQTQKDILTDQGEFMRSFLAIYNSAGYKWQRLMEGFKVAMLQLGIAFLPVMTKIVGYILYFVQIISKASPHTKRLAAEIFAIGSALLFLGGIFVSATAGLASLYFWFRILGVGAAGLAGSGGGLALMATGLARISAVAIGVMVAMKGLKSVWDEFSQNDVQGNKLQKGLRGAAKYMDGIEKWMLGKKLSKKLGYFDKDGKSPWDNLIESMPGVFGKSTKKQKAAKKAIKSVQEMIDYVNKQVKKSMNAKGMAQKAGLSKEAIKALNDVINQTTTPSKAKAEQAKRAQDIVAEQKSILDQASQGLMRMYDEKKQQNEQAFGALFSGPISQSGAVMWRKQFGIQMSPKEMLEDFRAQLKQFQTMRSQITSLRKRGLSGEIVSDLQARGAEGMPYLKALMQATPKQIKEFNSMMGSKKKDITKATEIDFNSQLAKWMQFGASAALKIAAGMESEEYKVQTRLNALASRLWSGVAKTIAAQQINIQYGVLPAMKGAPPLASGSGAMAHGISAAAYAANLQSQGYYTYNPNLVNPDFVGPAGPGGNGRPSTAKRPSQAERNRRRNTQSVEEHTHFHINGTFMSEEQMMDRALQGAAFKKKQRRR